MKSLPHQLYDGEITPQKKECPKSAEYIRKQREWGDRYGRLSSQLTPEQGEELEQLMEGCRELFYLESADLFSSGFRMGARLMNEVLSEEE